jgi:hypothetical protein
MHVTLRRVGASTALLAAFLAFAQPAPAAPSAADEKFEALGKRFVDEFGR